MTDLVFSQSPITGSPTHLVFGDDAPPAPVTITANIVISLSGDVVVDASVIYDNRVTPWLDQRAALPHQTAVPDVMSTGAAWGVSTPKRGIVEHGWQTATPSEKVTAIPYLSSVPVRLRTGAPWETAGHDERTFSVVQQQAVRQGTLREAPWQEADRRGITHALRLDAGVFKALQDAVHWRTAAESGRNVRDRMGASAHRIGVPSSAMPWQMAGQARNGLSIMPPPLPPDQVIQFRDGHLVFECPPLSVPNLVFGVHACHLPPGIPGAVIVPVRRVYIVLNEASLRRVDGNIPLPTFGMTLSLDVDSWTWGFSASLPGSALADLEPASGGAPVEVEAMVNGVAYRALVESIGRDRSFGKSGLRVQGRGKTALLDSPYAPTKSFGNTQARTAQQLMGDVLTVNGVAMDWTVNWGLEDWLVPASVFGHQGSYISALNAIAGAAGGYIQPHASLQHLSVLPRYPAVPWDWDSITPDYQLPADVTTRETIEWVERARYNRVYVSGQQAGVLGQVTRAGTAGDLVAPMVTDMLVTTAAAARQRGLGILSNTGRQANVSLRLPVLAETGVITPGRFVRYTDAGAARMGIVRSTSVDVGLPEVWQTIGVETHV